MKKRNLMTFVGILLAGGILAGCSNSNNSKSNSDPQAMKAAVSDQMATLNTAKYSDMISLEAMDNAFEGLYRFDSKGKPVLAGAQSVSHNEAQDVYTQPAKFDHLKL